MWDALIWLFAILILTGVLWLIWQMYFIFMGYKDSYVSAQEKDMNEYKGRYDVGRSAQAQGYSAEEGKTGLMAIKGLNHNVE